MPERLTRALKEGLDRIAAEGDRSEHLAAILDSACRWVGADRGHVFEYLESTNQLRTVASWRAGQAHPGPAPDDPEFLQLFDASHNDNFPELCRRDRVRYFHPETFLEQVWPGTRPWHAQNGHRCALALPLMASGQALGEMALVFQQPQSWQELPVDEIQALATQAGLLLLLQRLFNEKEEALLRQERTRLAREMHDGIAQDLIGLLMILRQQPDLAPQLERLAQRALNETRRSVFALRAPALQEGFIEGVQDLLQDRNFDGKLAVGGNLREIPPHWEHEIYRALQEGLSNVARHSNARQVQLSLDYTAEALEVSLRDDGCGFNTQEIPGRGLAGLRERLELLGAHLELVSQPDCGTWLQIRLPWKA